MNAEFFIPVPHYEDKYAVSDLGSVKSLTRKVPNGRGKTRLIPGRVLKPLVDKNGYFTVVLCGHKRRTQIKLHRLVLSAFSVSQRNFDADHIDGDPANNHLSNLRWATKSQNGMNSRARTGSASSYKGVSKSGSSWRATIKVNSKQIHLGSFKSERAAAMAYDAAAISAFGQFARPNFPQMQRDYAEMGVRLTDPETAKYEGAAA